MAERYPLPHSLNRVRSQRCPRLVIRPDPAHKKVIGAQQPLLKAVTSSPPHFREVSRTLPRRAALPPACSVVQGNEGWLAKA